MKKSLSSIVLLSILALPASAFAELPNFVMRATPNTQNIKKTLIENNLTPTNFNNLRNLEDKNGFDEATKHSKFFRSGTSNQWKDVLTNTQINLIEKNLKSMMRYFNYI